MGTASSKHKKDVKRIPILIETVNGTHRLEDLVIYERVALKRISIKYDRMVQTIFI
jgi:hypothetical protein